jgi:hypothetical protein
VQTARPAGASEGAQSVAWRGIAGIRRVLRNGVLINGFVQIARLRIHANGRKKSAHAARIFYQANAETAVQPCAGGT